MVVREKGAFDLTWRCLISSQERFVLLSQQKGRGAGTYWTGNLGPKFWEAFAAGSAAVFDLLLGDNLQGRKEHIAENGYKYLEMADIS